jgi:hypothetical protein
VARVVHTDVTILRLQQRKNRFDDEALTMNRALLGWPFASLSRPVTSFIPRESEYLESHVKEVVGKRYALHQLPPTDAQRWIGRRTKNPTLLQYGTEVEGRAPPSMTDATMSLVISYSKSREKASTQSPIYISSSVRR